MAPVVVPWADNVLLTRAANSAAPRNVQREIFIQWGSLFDEMPGVGIALRPRGVGCELAGLENLGAIAVGVGRVGKGVSPARGPRGAAAQRTPIPSAGEFRARARGSRDFL